MRVIFPTATAALLALAVMGCAKKAPPELLPAPLSDGTGADETGEFDADAALQALRRDFIAQAGSDSVFFDTDSSVLDAADRATLDAQAAWLSTHPGVTVTVEGHCDERGTRDYNLALGDRRSIAAKNYLAARGVSEARMRTVSWGKERPIAMGSDETAWAQNRRAVTVLISSQ